MSEQLWVRVGDAGDYEPCGDDLDALIDYLNELGIGQVDHWIDAGPGIGFATPNYHGHDFISLFWGDADANLVRRLNREERAIVESGLVECYI
jgi:hypothetical protein